MFHKPAMRTIVLLVIALGCALGAASAQVKGTAASSGVLIGTPGLVVPEYYFDFGEVNEKTEYLHSFVIGNNGTGVLEITKINPG